MRLLFEIIVATALVYVGWDKPFHDWLPQDKPPVAVATPSPPPQATPTPQPAWMNDPNRRSPLDTARASRQQPAQVQSTPKPKSWLFDPNHHSTLDPPQNAPKP